MLRSISMATIDPAKYKKAKEAVDYYAGGGSYSPGSFALALVECIFKADSDNLVKLHEVFPEYVDAVIDHRHGTNTASISSLPTKNKEDQK
jgi:hypothetical protein